MNPDQTLYPDTFSVVFMFFFYIGFFFVAKGQEGRVWFFDFGTKAKKKVNENKAAQHGRP